MTRWTNPGILALFTVLALGACKKKTEEEMPNPAPKVETPATPEPAKVAATAPTKAPTAAPEKPAEPEPTEPAAPPPPVHTAAVCAGGGHTCYLKASGEVLCVGDNIDGQLGDGTAMNRSMPSPVADLSGVMEIACGPITPARAAGRHGHVLGPELARRAGLRGQGPDADARGGQGPDRRQAAHARLRLSR